MRKFKDLSENEKEYHKDVMFDQNTITAAKGLLGFAVKRLAPTKENFEKFQKQFNGHPMCGCYSCIELGKQFALKTPEIKEEIIGEATYDLDRLTVE